MQRITGEMARRFREFDWAATPVGPPRRWPNSWRTALDISLASDFPTALALGPQHIYFYNDAFIPIGGPARHPQAIGLPVREVWQEIWQPVLEPRFRQTLATGLPTGAEELMLPLERRGYVEETYMTFSFAALKDEDGIPSGIFCNATEDTALVIARRQLECLRRLTAECAAADCPETACRLAADILEQHGRDVPFALFYLLRGERFEIAYSAGLSAPPHELEATGTLAGLAPWTLAQAGRGPLLIENLSERIAPLLRPGHAVAKNILAWAIGGGGSETPCCILAAGLNPLRPVGESGEFLGLVAAQLEKAIAGARVKQHAEERARHLAELDRAKTLFFSNVSHELRTPLTLLLEPVRQVLEETRLEPEQRELLMTARRAGGRLLNLVSSLLEFSRIEAGRTDARYVPIDLGQLTTDLAGMFRSPFELAGITLCIDCPAGLEPAYVDTDMWERIVLNLLSNALKFTFEGRVTVRLRECAAHFVLEVADTGCGIAEADLPRIFERFTPRTATRARTAEGAGIGLSLVQEFVKLHGGTLEASSRIDEGTTLTVRIPRGSAHLPTERLGTSRTHINLDRDAQPFLDEALGWLAKSDATPPLQTETPWDAEAPHRATRLPHAPLDSEEPLSGAQITAPQERILIVDDNAEMRRYLARLLQGRWQVKAAPDGAAALEQIRGERPDLLIADIMMPRMDGLEMLSAIRSDPLTCEIPVLLLSARAGPLASVQGLNAGAVDYLVKPFSQPELIARIEARLAQAKQHAAERSAREQAERDVRARDDFFAALAHELRSPMMSIFLWSEALRAKTLSHRQRIEAVDAMELAAGTLRRLAEDLHDVARAASGKIRVERRRFADLTPLVAAVTKAFAPAAAEKSLSLLTSLERDSGPVLIDADRMQQIVSNLLSNAIRYTPPGGWIEVHCARRIDIVEIRVRDCGRGIARDALPHVFERYWRGAAALDDDSGLGLGLAIVRWLIELQDGQIEVASEGEDRGATFIVSLPVAVAETGSAETRITKPGRRLKDAARAATEMAARQAASRARSDS